MQFTLQLFRRLYDHLPPLVPAEIKTAMRQALESFEQGGAAALSTVEDAMIKFGYQVWPWVQAYREWLLVAEAKVGEHFLLPKLSPKLAARYAEFKLYSGGLQDLHTGQGAGWFESEERAELCTALVELKADLRRFVFHAIVGTDESRFLARVAELVEVMVEVKGRLEELTELAAREADHPQLAAEIRAKVRGFEEGLCLLGPELNYEAVCQSADFFRGRREELTRFKGLHLPLQIDFYTA